MYFKNYCYNLVLWLMPVIPAAQVAEAGEFLKIPRKPLQTRELTQEIVISR